MRHHPAFHRVLLEMGRMKGDGVALPGDDLTRALVDIPASTVRHWVRAGYLSRRGDGIVLTREGYDVA